MHTQFNRKLGSSYKSRTQQIRVMSESWIMENAYCVACGSLLLQYPNNKPFADLFCPKCGEEYEIKCSKNSILKRIVDGAYATMIEKILKGLSPNMFHIQYAPNTYDVLTLTLIPRQFIVPDIIIKRPPLSDKARRRGWIGCIIASERIPSSGKIAILVNGVETTQSEVLKMYQRVKFIQSDKLAYRGWTMDVMRCIEKLNKPIFLLSEMYQFIGELSRLHPANKNIEAKIRQQLQILRNAGYLNFLGRGRYSLHE